MRLGDAPRMRHGDTMHCDACHSVCLYGDGPSFICRECNLRVGPCCISSGERGDMCINCDVSPRWGEMITADVDAHFTWRHAVSRVGDAFDDAMAIGR